MSLGRQGLGLTMVNGAWRGQVPEDQRKTQGQLPHRDPQLPLLVSSHPLDLPEAHLVSVVGACKSAWDWFGASQHSWCLIQHPGINRFKP